MRQQKYRERGTSRFRSIGVVALGLGAALALTGCGAGQAAQTAQERPAINGAIGKSEKVAIRDATLVYPVKTKGVYPKGSDAELAMTIVNRSVRKDKLVKVTSKIAKDVTVKGSRVVPGVGTLVVGEPAHAGTGGAEDAQVPTSGEKKTGHVRIVLNHLTLPVRSGLTAKATFVFASGASITVDMPVATPPHHPGDRGYGEKSGEGEHASEGEQASGEE